MAKMETIQVRLTRETETEVRALARTAGLKPEQVIALAMAVGVRRWDRESGVRGERDVAVDTLRQIASGKRRTREQRLALSCVTFLDECSNVQPNNQAHLRERE